MRKLTFRTRLRLLILANECKTLEEFRQRLQEIINRQ